MMYDPDALVRWVNRALLVLAVLAGVGVYTIVKWIFF